MKITNRILNSWIHFIHKFYWVILLLGIGIGGISLPKMIHLLQHISTDPIDLLPEHHHNVQTLLEVRKKFTARPTTTVVIESEKPENAKKALEDIAKKFEQLPAIQKSEYKKPGYQFLDQHKLLFLSLTDLGKLKDQLQRKIQQKKLGGLYVNLEEEESSEKFDLEKLKKKYGEGIQSEYFVSESGKIFALHLEGKETDPGIATTARFIRTIQDELKKIDLSSYQDPTLKIYLDGASKVIEYQTLMKDLKNAGIISGILLLLPLLIRFRKPHWIFLIFLPLAIGIPAGFWIAGIWIQKLNVITSFLFAILGGLGVETGIHLFSRYYHDRTTGKGIVESLQDLYFVQGPSILTAVAALTSTFLLMLFSQFKGFSEFGLISAIGLWTVLLFYFTFFPALLIFSEKIKLLRLKTNTTSTDSFSDLKRRSFGLSRPLLQSLLVILVLFTFFSFGSARSIPFEYDAKKIRLDSPELTLAKSKQREAHGNRVNTPAVLLVQNETEAKALKEEIEKRKSENPNSLIEKTASLYSLMPDQQPEKMQTIGEIRNLLQDETLKMVKGEKKEDLDRFKQAVEESSPVVWEEIPDILKHRFIGDNKGGGSLFLIDPKPNIELGDGRNAIAFAKEIGTIPTALRTLYPSSDSIVYGNVLIALFRDAKLVLPISIFSLFVFTYLSFKSLKKTALILVSILSGLFWMFGIFWIIGLKLNLYNMVLIPSVMGMSIDNAIHLYHSYEELGRGTLRKVLQTSGLACLLASLTNASGFIGLLFCQHGGLRSMGILATIGVCTCLLSTLVFLPMMLKYRELRTEKKVLNESSGLAKFSDL